MWDALNSNSMYSFPFLILPIADWENIKKKLDWVDTSCFLNGGRGKKCICQFVRTKFVGILCMCGIFRGSGKNGESAILKQFVSGNFQKNVLVRRRQWSYINHVNISGRYETGLGRGDGACQKMKKKGRGQGVVHNPFWQLSSSISRHVLHAVFQFNGYCYQHRTSRKVAVMYQYSNFFILSRGLQY